MVDQMDPPNTGPTGEPSNGAPNPGPTSTPPGPTSAPPGPTSTNPGPNPGPTGEGWSAPPADDRQARWMGQLQAMIDDVATTAGPTLRELAAKAAELAAKAGDSAGPLAHRAAIATTDVGQRVAARGREIATDMRRAADGDGNDTPPATESAPDAAMPDPTTEQHPGV
jgi:hypothetical protein